MTGQVVSLASGRARLGEWGDIVLDRTCGVRITTVDERSVEVGDPDTMAFASAIALWLDDGGQLLVGAEVMKALYRVDLTDLTVTVERLDREEGPRLRHLALYPLDHGPLVLYEGGLLCYDEGVTLRWHVRHGDLSARLAGVTHEGAVLESQWPPDRSGQTRVFRWADGSEVT